MLHTNYLPFLLLLCSSFLPSLLLSRAPKTIRNDKEMHSRRGHAGPSFTALSAGAEKPRGAAAGATEKERDERSHWAAQEAKGPDVDDVYTPRDEDEFESALVEEKVLLEHRFSRDSAP